MAPHGLSCFSARLRAKAGLAEPSSPFPQEGCPACPADKPQQSPGNWSVPMGTAWLVSDQDLVPSERVADLHAPGAPAGVSPRACWPD